MAGFFKKLADRFRPHPMEQLQQSANDKKKVRELKTLDKPHVQLPERRLISQTIDMEPTGGFRTSQEWEVFSNHHNGIWRQWHDTTSTNNITTCTTYNDPWDAWHTNRCITTAGTSDTIWVGWHTANTATITTNRITVTGRWANWVDEAERTRPARHESAKQRKKREEEEARYRVEEEARHARYLEETRASENRRKAADDRAMKLLMALLNEEQRADVKKHNHFFVNAKSGRLYRIDIGTHGNVKVVDRVSRKIIERLCIQPNGVPAADANLTQKLMIESAEEAFRAHANITLEDGSLVRGDPTPLTGDKLAKIIPLRKAA